MQTSYGYKRAVYHLCRNPPLALDKRLRGQLEDSVAGPPAHIAEGYGRFNPLDFGRFAVMARSSLMESQNHLLDAVDRGSVRNFVCEAVDHSAGRVNRPS